MVGSFMQSQILKSKVGLLCKSWYLCILCKQVIDYIIIFPLSLAAYVIGCL